MRHLSEDGLPRFLSEAHGYGSDIKIEADFRCPRLSVQHESCAQRGMSSEGQFFLHGEDARANSAGAFRGGVPRKDESSFGEISFARQCLHPLGAKAAAVREHRQRIAGESAVSKHIDLHHTQPDHT